MTSADFRAQITNLTGQVGKLETRCVTLETQRSFFERSAQEWHSRHTDLQNQFSHHIVQSDEKIKALLALVRNWENSQRDLLLAFGVVVEFLQRLLALPADLPETGMGGSLDREWLQLRDHVQGWLDVLPVPILEGILQATSQQRETEVLIATETEPPT